MALGCSTLRRRSNARLRAALSELSRRLPDAPSGFAALVFLCASGHVAAAGWARARGFSPTSERTRSNRPQTEPSDLWSARARLVCAELPSPRSPATSAPHRSTQFVSRATDFQSLLVRNAFSISTGVGRLLPETRRSAILADGPSFTDGSGFCSHGSPSGARQRGSAASDACIYVVFAAGATQASRPSRPRRESR